MWDLQNNQDYRTAV